MMPLTMVKTGETNVIRKVGGKEETRRFLENLGFVVGSEVVVVSEISGNLIVNIKDSRVAMWRNSKSSKVSRYRSCKKAYYGHGYHKRSRCLCA